MAWKWIARQCGRSGKSGSFVQFAGSALTAAGVGCIWFLGNAAWHQDVEPVLHVQPGIYVDSSGVGLVEWQAERDPEDGRAHAISARCEGGEPAVRLISHRKTLTPEARAEMGRIAEAGIGNLLLEVGGRNLPKVRREHRLRIERRGRATTTRGTPRGNRGFRSMRLPGTLLAANTLGGDTIITIRNVDERAIYRIRGNSAAGTTLAGCVLD